MLMLANFASLESATAITTANCRDTFGTPGNVTVTVVGNDCLLRFTGTSTWTIPSGTTSVRFLLVGGGASGYIDGGGGGGGGGGLYHSGVSVTSGNTAIVTVGAGGNRDWTPTNGGASYLDTNGDGSAEWSAAGGSRGDGWATRAGGVGGQTSAQSGATAYNGGNGGMGPYYQNTNYAAHEAGADGFSNDITGSTIFYGGGGGGGMSSHSGGTSQINIDYKVGGKGGGGAGAAQRPKGTSVSWTYTGIENSSTSQSLTANCTGNYYGTTMGFNGLNGYGGGGGGGSAHGDGCIANPNTYDDGERNAGGGGGSGVVYIRYTPDVTAPVFTGPGSSTGATSSISVAENQTSVHTFTANESVTWTKSGTDSIFFSINSSGVLTISSRDFETKVDSNGDNVYIVVVTATDVSTNQTQQTVSVTITNVNEAPTIGAYSSAATTTYSVAENLTALFNLSATDVDAGTSLNYSLTGTDSGDFAISAIGALTLNPAADYENPLDSDRNNTYNVSAWVSDGVLSDSITVTVTVTNANESAELGTPSISGTLYKGVSASITVTTNAPGKVRFFMDGKRISSCLAVATTGTYSTHTATCTFKPSATSRRSFYATLTPSDNTFSSATSPKLFTYVLNRGTIR